MKAILVLQDGTVFEGSSFGSEGLAYLNSSVDQSLDSNSNLNLDPNSNLVSAVSSSPTLHPKSNPFIIAGEVVFNTSMSGYQEVLTDPSYKWQIVCMTYPEIGNYGVNFEDGESSHPQVSGFIVKQYNAEPSNFRAKQSLGDYLKQHHIPALEGIDTRALVRHLRNVGAMPGLIAVGDSLDLNSLIAQARMLPSIEGKNLVSEVTCKSSYRWTEPLHHLIEEGSLFSQWRSPWFQSEPELRSEVNIAADFVSKLESNSSFCSLDPSPDRPKIIAYDFGIKRNILRYLVSFGFDVTVVPAHTSAQELLERNPSGVFLSNGPGDPAVVYDAIETVRQLVGKLPIFGICLGHQILGLALGARTYKLKFGHRGGNQPVLHLDSGRVEITSQNHGFAMDEASLPSGVRVTHRNLNDGTVEGMEDRSRRFFSVQYHPEASPGPHDAHYLFRQFYEWVKRGSQERDFNTPQ